MNGYPDGCTQHDHDMAYGGFNPRRKPVDDPWREARKEKDRYLREALDKAPQNSLSVDEKGPGAA